MGEKHLCEREISINQLPLGCCQPATWPAMQSCVLTGNQTGYPLVHRPVLNPVSHTREGCFSVCFILFFNKLLNISVC